MADNVVHTSNEGVNYEHTPSSKQVFYDGNYVTCYPRVKSNR